MDAKSWGKKGRCRLWTEPVEIAPLPATSNTVLPVVAAVFGGLVVAGAILLLVLVLVLVLVLMRRRRPSPA